MKLLSPLGKWSSTSIRHFIRTRYLIDIYNQVAYFKLGREGQWYRDHIVQRRSYAILAGRQVVTNKPSLSKLIPADFETRNETRHLVWSDRTKQTQDYTDEIETWEDYLFTLPIWKQNIIKYLIH